MHKKLIMACMAIAACTAFIGPGASASPVLTDETPSGFQPVPNGVDIESETTGSTEFQGGFNVICSNANIVGKLTANTGTEVAVESPAGSAKFTGTGTGGDCTSALGTVSMTVNSKICFKTVKGTDNVSITGCGGSFTFSLNVTGVITCKYSAASLTGTYKTNDDATVNVSSQPVSEEEPRSFFCPDSGNLFFDLDMWTSALIGHGATVFAS